MKRFFQSIRFQLTITIVIFILVNTIFIASVTLRNFEKGITDIETSRISVIASQLTERYERMYRSEYIARNFADISEEQQRIYLRLFLKTSFEEYFNDLIKNFPELEFGYSIPAIEDSTVFVGNNTYRFDKKLTVVKNVNAGHGGGYIFVDEPLPIVMKPLQEIREDINRIIIYSVIVAIFLVLIVTTLFTRRIINIRRGLKILEKDLDFRFPQFGGEIGDIALSINSMAENLKKNIDAMQRSESLRSLGMFTVGVVHEVRNPLTSIKGFAQILQKKLQGKEEEKYINPILIEADRLGKVVDDLLRFGRPAKIDKKVFNLNSFFDHIVEMSKHYVGDKNIVISKECEGDININADEKKLEELFLNLVINGIQSLEEGNGEVSIQVRKTGENVVVNIRDTGIGMTEEEMKNLFVPFYTTKAEGTGMGLAIAYRAATEHDGKIDVQSVKGEGTVFTVTLPLGI